MVGVALAARTVIQNGVVARLESKILRMTKNIHVFNIRQTKFPI